MKNRAIIILSFYQEEHLKQFQRNAEENSLIFDSLYAKKDIPIVTQSKPETKEPEILEKAKVEEPKIELVQETKPTVQNTNIDDWLDDLIN